MVNICFKARFWQSFLINVYVIIMVKITSFIWKANRRASCLPWKRKHPYYLLSVFMVYLSVGHDWLQRSNFQVNFHDIYNAFYFECSQISEFTWWARPLIISFMAPQTKGRITTILILNNYRCPRISWNSARSLSVTYWRLVARQFLVFYQISHSSLTQSKKQSLFLWTCSSVFFSLRKI